MNLFSWSRVILSYLCAENNQWKISDSSVTAHFSNIAVPKKNISMHKIPFLSEESPIKKKGTKRIDFLLERRKTGAGETLLVVLAPLYCKRFWKPIDSELNLRHELKKDDIGVCFHPWQEIILPCYPIYLCFKWLILWWNMPFLAHGWRSHAMGFWWHSNDARSLTHSILINLFI